MSERAVRVARYDGLELRLVGADRSLVLARLWVTRTAPGAAPAGGATLKAAFVGPVRS